MELSPEEYGRYWRGAIRIAAGILVAAGGWRLLAPMIDHPDPMATLFGVAVLAVVVLVGTFVAVLGLARVVRAAVRAER